LRKLESIIALTAAERDALAAVPMSVEEFRADQDIVREGDRPTRCFVLLRGVVCSYKLVAAGERQILCFYLAGDVPDLQSLHLPVLDNTFATITPASLGFIEHTALRELCAAFPRITAALWRETLVEAAIFRAWLTNIGRREAYSRIAHLCCEIFAKSEAVGLTEGGSCEFPITQQEIADALGLSTVHVNRSLQELRAQGLISLSRGVLTVLDRRRLEAAAGFDASYLHLRQSEA
jgi:CRP-like cAMP-binding protein